MTFRELDLGSARIATILLTQEQLVDLAGIIQTRALIVDLSKLESFGAALIGCLVAVGKRLKREGRELVICGDRLGLCKIVCLNQLYPVVPCQSDANAWLASVPTMMSSANAANAS